MTAPPSFAVAASQDTVTIFKTHNVRDKPGGKVVTSVLASRPITGQKTVLPVLARRYDSQRRYWLKVRLPGRTLSEPSAPRNGWIRALSAHMGQTSMHITVNTHTRRMSLFEDGRMIKQFKVIVGASETPTPRGIFFIEETVKMPRGSVGAPYALALSARSQVLQEFAGGPGQIALHGRGGVGGILGTAVSHGCVRLDDAAVTYIARRVSPGVPVTIF